MNNIKCYIMNFQIMFCTSNTIKLCARNSNITNNLELKKRKNLLFFVLCFCFQNRLLPHDFFSLSAFHKELELHFVPVSWNASFPLFQDQEKLIMWQRYQLGLLFHPGEIWLHHWRDRRTWYFTDEPAPYLPCLIYPRTNHLREISLYLVYNPLLFSKCSLDCFLRMSVVLKMSINWNHNGIYLHCHEISYFFK